MHNGLYTFTPPLKKLFSGMALLMCTIHIDFNSRLDDNKSNVYQPCILL